MRVRSWPSSRGALLGLQQPRLPHGQRGVAAKEGHQLLVIWGEGVGRAGS